VALLALISGLLALAAVVAGIAFAVVRTRELLRGFRSFGRALGVATAKLEESSRRLAEGKPDAGDSAAKLAESLDRLSTSRARLGVLLAALGDVRSAVTRLTAVAPRK
jgi:hypothetical protein